MIYNRINHIFFWQAGICYFSFGVYSGQGKWVAPMPQKIQVLSVA